MLIVFNELVKNESLRQEDILNDIRAGRCREKDHPEVWIPEIPLSYYEFKREQQYTEDLEMRYAATNPEESSDDNIPINRKIAKPRSNIKKVAHIFHVESKRAKTVSVSVKTKPPTKRPAAEPTTKRPAAEPLGDVSNNVGGRPKRITKKPKKSEDDGGGGRGGDQEQRRKTTTAGMERPAENGGGIEPEYLCQQMSFFVVDPLIIGIEIAYHLL